MKTISFLEQNPQDTRLILVTAVFFLTLLNLQPLVAQVGINNINPNATLDITATNPTTPTPTDGVLVPRVSTFPSTDPGAAQDGLLIYLTATVGTNPPGFYFWSNSSGNWVSITDSTTDSGAQQINDLSDGITDATGGSIFLGTNAGLNDDDTNNRNIGLGRSALTSVTSGQFNIAIGDASLALNTTGNFNVGVGANVLWQSVSASYNNGFGNAALYSLTAGDYNTALGHQAMVQSTNAQNNTVVGANALRSNLTANDNAAFGYESLRDNLTNGLSAFGSNSLRSNTSGSLNSAFGYYSLAANTTGSANTAIGNNALTSNTIGSGNAALGDASLEINTSGLNNTGIGSQTLINNQSGGFNTALGYAAGAGINGNNNTFLGYFAGSLSSTGSPISGGVYIGFQAGRGETNSNRLYIENSNAGPNNALIYGEFDSDILRTNSSFQIGNPAISGYEFPNTDGTSDQLLLTDGAGNLNWTNASSLYSDDIDFYEIGTTNAPDDITDNIYTQGSLVIGNSTLASTNSLLEASKTGFAAIRLGSQDNGAVGLQLERSGAGQEFSFLSTSSGGLDVFSFGRDLPGFTGGSLDFMLDENGDISLAAVVTEPENRISIGQSANTTNTTDKVTIRGMGNTSATNALLIKNQSNVTIAQFKDDGSFTLGAASGVDYTFPTVRGTTGQFLQTDGFGNLNWANSSSFWSRSGTELDVATANDDISFSSDQTSITFPATTGAPSSMMYLFDSGTSNSDRMVFSQSPAFSSWGLMYRDAGDSFRFVQAGSDRVVINLGGGNPLVVNGNAQATAFVSATTTYPDYVFEHYYQGESLLNKDYQFLSLKEVENFIETHGHLPGVKSYAEIEQNDMQIDLGATAVVNLEKIEELFLYAIELKKENEVLESKMELLEKRLALLEATLVNNQD